MRRFGEWIKKGKQLKFCDHLRAVVGHRRFDCDKKESILSNWITVSDEAFAMLVGKNNIDQWIDMYRRDDKKKKSDVIPRYTNGGKSQVRNGSSQRCKGWTVEGTKQYGQLYCLVEKERATVSRQEFEEDYP